MKIKSNFALLVHPVVKARDKTLQNVIASRIPSAIRKTSKVILSKVLT